MSKEKILELVAWLEAESERCRLEIVDRNLKGEEMEHFFAGQVCYNHIAGKIRSLLNEDNQT